MNILFAMDGMGYGGAERVISVLANEFVKRNHQVFILLICAEKKPSAYRLENSIGYDWIESKSYSSFKEVKALHKKMEKYFWKTKPDIVISFLHIVCSKCIYTCKKLGIPLIYSERNDPSNYFRDLKSKLYQLYLQLNVKYVVFQTGGAQRLYPKRLRKNSRIIFNPVDYSNFPNYYDGVRKKEIVSVGRLVGQKNQKLLIQAFSEIANKFPDYILKIYGEGKLRDELTAQINDLRLNNKIFLVGNESDVLNKINEASVFVFTSDYEGLPNALIEAMALGLPCISTKCSPGGAEAIIDDSNTGFLVDCDDCVALAEKMNFVLSHYEDCLEIGKKARNIRKMTEVQTITDEWEKYIRSIVNNDRCRHIYI